MSTKDEPIEQKYTIAVGNIADGVHLHGLYDDPNDASEEACCSFKHEDWHVLTIWMDHDYDH